MVKLQLDRWLKQAETSGEQHQEVVKLPLELIKPSPYQTRVDFDEADLLELAQSIQEYGVIQPVVVRHTPGGYELVAGERRVRASRMAGLVDIPALVVDLEDEKAAAVTLIENLQRSSLNYLEEAEAYALLLGEFGLKQEELAKRVGKSQSAVANKIRLLKLPAEVRSRIQVDLVSERHARALLSLPTPEQQIQVLDKIIQKELTVKATEELIQRMLKEKTTGEKKKTDSDPSLMTTRSYINSIKEIVFKARDNGVNMVCMENRVEDGYEILIKIPKPKQ